MKNEVFKHYTLGIPKLDEEHRNLIELMETIVKCGECRDKEKCDVTIQHLQECFEQHLKDEEDYMIRIEYPYYEWHHALHNDIRRMLKNIIDQMKLNEYRTDKWMTQRIRDIFVKHIDEQDMQIVNWINKNRM